MAGENNNTEKNYTEVGTVPVYKRAKNLLSFSNYIGDLTAGDKKVGEICSGLNGDIIVSLGENDERETFVVKVNDIVEFLNNRKG